MNLKHFGCVVLACLCVAVSAQAEEEELVIYDHFDGAEVDSNLWLVENSGTATATQASSVVTLTTSTGNDYFSLYSQSAVADHYGTYEFKIGSTFTGGRNYFGFNNTNANCIYVYGSDNDYKLSVVADGTWNGDKPITAVPQAGQIWTIDWSESGVDIYVDGVLSIHSEDSPDPSAEPLKYRLLSGWGPNGGAMGIDYLGERITSGPSLPGDLNDDGFVGGDDLDIVRSFWGQNVTAGDLLQGDPSNDGFVGGDDLDIVRANWGQGTPPAPASVPEPGTVILLLVSAAMLFSGRRWQVRAM